MRTIPLQEAGAHLSILIEQAANGDPFVISKAGQPLVKVVPVDAPQPTIKRRVGFMAGQLTVPDDFDEMGRADIERLFGGTAE